MVIAYTVDAPLAVIVLFFYNQIFNVNRNLKLQYRTKNTSNFNLH
jgi:hypothetical protein